MSGVDFKSPVTSQNVNDAFMSRNGDTDTTGVVDLLNAGSTPVPDVQNRINVESGRVDQNETDIVTNAGNITTNAGNISTNATNIQTNADNIQAINDAKGQANGFAELDAGGRVPESQLPLKLKENEGPWNAATNTPTLADTDVGAEGNTYYVTVAGTVDFGSGPIDFEPEDFVYNDGSVWRKNASGKVNSINGQDGDVVLDADDVAETATRKYEKVIHNREATTDPTVSNDTTEGYGVGSEWWNKDTNTMYRCSDNTAGAAVWEEAAGSGPGGGAGSLNTFYQEDFETNGANIFVNIGNTWSSQNNLGDPLKGVRSALFTQQVGSAGGIQRLGAGIVLENDQVNSQCLLELRARTIVDSNGEYILRVTESSDNVTYTTANELSFKPTKDAKSYGVYFTPKETTTHLKYEFEVLIEDDGAQLDVDSISMTTNPIQTIEFDNIGEWEPLNVTTNADTGTVTCLGKQFGDELIVRGQIDFSGKPTGLGFSAVEIFFTDYTINTNKIIAPVSFNSSELNGTAQFFDNGTGTFNARVAYAATNSIRFNYLKNFSGVQYYAGIDPEEFGGIAAGDQITFYASIPMNELSVKTSAIVAEGEVQNQAETKYLASAVTSAGDIASLQFDGLIIGEEYEVFGKAWFSVEAASTIRVYLRSAPGNTGELYGGVDYRDKEASAGGATNLADQPVGTTFTAASTSLYVYFDNFGQASNIISGNGTKLRTHLQLRKKGKEVAVVVPTVKSDKKFMLYRGTNAQAVLDTQTIIYNNKVFDNLGGYDSSTGVFTCEEEGNYTFKGVFTTAALSTSAGGIVALNIRDNANGVSYVGKRDTSFSTAARNFVGENEITLPLEIGNTVEFKFTENVANINMNGSAGNNFMNIIKEDNVNDTVIGKDIITPLVSGQIVDTNETFKGKRIKKWVYEVTSDITSSATITSIAPGLNPVGHLSQANGFWVMYQANFGTGFEVIITYEKATGNIATTITGSWGVFAGTVLELRFME